MRPPFEILEHPSDLGIQAHGSSMQELFRNAARGLISVIAGTSIIEPLQERSVTISALDRENLMVRWLTEILYQYDAEKFLIADVKFETLDETKIQAKLLGEFYRESRHTLRLDVKAVTYHQLKVKQEQEGWTAVIFLDI